MRNIFCSLVLLSICFSQAGTARYGQISTQPGNRIIGPSFETQSDLVNVIPLEEAINPKTYVLGPGDQLGINIVSSQSTLLTVLVNPSGDILIPNIGIIRISGLSLINAIVLIESYIKERNKNSLVYISLVSIREFLIQIHGAVNKPGFVSVTPLTRLSKIIKKSGGFHQFAREYQIMIYHKGNYIKTINYLDYLRTGDLENNPIFAEGDEIVVEYGSIEREGIVIRGEVTGTGYDILEPGETLSDLMKRRIRFKNDADLSSITVTRNNLSGKSIITLKTKDYSNFILQANDIIDIISEPNVMVNGYVKYPGAYKYFPGYKALDYINLAGGNTVEGDVDKSKVVHKNGKEEEGKDIMIKRGDVIIVKASTGYVLKGDQSILQMATIFSSLILTYIAATK